MGTLLDPPQGAERLTWEPEYSRRAYRTLSIGMELAPASRRTDVAGAGYTQVT